MAEEADYITRARQRMAAMGLGKPEQDQLLTFARMKANDALQAAKKAGQEIPADYLDNTMEGFVTKGIEGMAKGFAALMPASGSVDTSERKF